MRSAAMLASALAVAAMHAAPSAPTCTTVSTMVHNVSAPGFIAPSRHGFPDWERVSHKSYKQHAATTPRTPPSGHNCYLQARPQSGLYTYDPWGSNFDGLAHSIGLGYVTDSVNTTAGTNALASCGHGEHPPAGWNPESWHTM